MYLRVYIKGRFSDFQSDDMSSNLVVRKNSKDGVKEKKKGGGYNLIGRVHALQV